MENHTEVDGDCLSFEEDGYDGISEQEETLLYFGGLFSREENVRQKFMDNFSRSVKTWVGKTDNISAQNMLQAHLPTALRLSINAPYKDIRERFTDLLREVQGLGYIVPKPVFQGPSSFIPVKETVCYESTKQKALSQVQSQYEDAFIYDGRLSNMVQLLGHHPSYLSLFLKSYDILMQGSGPLPLHIRNYIAMLSASRHKCSYLVTLQEVEFLKNGGHQDWLKGTNEVPAKIRNLQILNKILAHQPWILKTEDVKNLVVGADSWSLSELVHAIAIMAHFHSLAGFCLGCGLNPEIDTQLGHTSTQNGESNFNHGHYSNPALGIGRRTPSDSESENLSPLTRSPTHPGMAQSLVKHFIETTSTSNGSTDKKLSASLTETLKIMENESSSSDEDSAEENIIMFEKAASSAGLERFSYPVPTPVSLVKYIEDPDFEHEDFTLSAATTLRAREYSWEDHGYPFLNSLYPDIGPLLDEKFKLALQMTYRMIGNEMDIDTGPFRQATWYYIHSIKGIRHDDYHYRKVNQVLSIQFKTYIRLIGCFPEKVSGNDFLHCVPGFQFSERIHVNILVLEARLQAELIYALRAIMNYMK